MLAWRWRVDEPARGLGALSSAVVAFERWRVLVSPHFILSVAVVLSAYSGSSGAEDCFDLLWWVKVDQIARDLFGGHYRICYAAPAPISASSAKSNRSAWYRGLATGASGPHSTRRKTYFEVFTGTEWLAVGVASLRLLFRTGIRRRVRGATFAEAPLLRAAPRPRPAMLRDGLLR